MKAQHALEIGGNMGSKKDLIRKDKSVNSKGQSINRVERAARDMNVLEEKPIYRPHSLELSPVSAVTLSEDSQFAMDKVQRVVLVWDWTGPLGLSLTPRQKLVQMGLAAQSDLGDLGVDSDRVKCALSSSAMHLAHSFGGYDSRLCLWGDAVVTDIDPLGIE